MNEGKTKISQMPPKLKRLIKEEIESFEYKHSNKFIISKDLVEDTWTALRFLKKICNPATPANEITDKHKEVFGKLSGDLIPKLYNLRGFSEKIYAMGERANEDEINHDNTDWEMNDIRRKEMDDSNDEPIGFPR